MSINPPSCHIQKDYSQPVCFPNSKSIWYNGTYNLISWDITNGLYFSYDKLNLFFYYRKNYQFFKTVNFTNIGASDGYYSVLVKNDWFPENCSQNNITWDYSALLIGENINPDDQINNKVSEWKRIDFKVVQNGTCIDNINNSTINNNTSNSSSVQSDTHFSNAKIDTWKIIVIVVCCVLLCLITITLIRLIYIKKIIIRKNKNYNEINGKNLKEIINQKPDINESIKDSNYSKPNEYINYEKPNSY
jgi:hypothetical protein